MPSHSTVAFAVLVLAMVLLHAKAEDSVKDRAKRRVGGYAAQAQQVSTGFVFSWSLEQTYLLNETSFIQVSAVQFPILHILHKTLTDKP